MRRLWLMPILLVLGCNRAAENKTDKINLLADLTCRAINIRQQRFALANKIRFTQDTLEHPKDKADSIRLATALNDYMIQKPILLKESLSLADGIRKQLDLQVPYTDKVAEQKFNAKLDSLLRARGCVDTAGHPIAN